MVARIVCADGDPEYAALIDETQWTALNFHGLTLDWFNGTPEHDNVWLERIGDADGLLLLWRVPDVVLRDAPNLKAIAWVGTGVSTFVNVPLATERGIRVFNTPGYGSVAVAEHTLGLMLALARNTVALDADIRRGRWIRDDVVGVELAGKTVGVIGLGGIGTRVAQLCHAIGMSVLAWTRNPTPERLADAGATYADIDDMLSVSDVVTLHVSHTAETDRLLSAARLHRLRSTAMLINTARAELMDEDALVDLLLNRRIAGAALDVFGTEPLPPDNPYHQLSNVILTPHIGFRTPEASRRSLAMALDALIGALGDTRQESSNGSV